MKLLLSTALSCAIVVASAVFLFSFANAEPSTQELDADIASVLVDIERARDDFDLYSGGAIQSLIQVRIETLNVTRAILEQKRASLIRRINLDYRVDGDRVAPDAERMAALESELASAERERAAQQAEADRYSGGLIQTMALMNVATNEMTMAQLRHALLTERYGLMLNPMASAPQRQPIGQDIVENDGDAL